jgi:hypothetical protein
MVVVTGREERGLKAEGTTVGDEVEAEAVAVEGDRAVEVGDAEVDVADADGGMDVGHGAKCPPPRRSGHRGVHLSARIPRCWSAAIASAKRSIASSAGSRRGPRVLWWRSRAVATALASAAREDRATRLALTPLSEAEAGELVGADVGALYRESGGNPFYLEQLARSRGNVRGALEIASLGVPEAVALAIGAELAGLAPEVRRVLDAATVVGDPFDPALAAEVADMPDALAALDDLLARTLVRPASGVRRFAFRHPVVQHAVYASAPAGRRLAAHARAAAALERRGAGVVARAHHVEHGAEPGDAAAAALLTEAARELHGPAPASAARFHAAALRLVADCANQIALAEARRRGGGARHAARRRRAGARPRRAPDADRPRGEHRVLARRTDEALQRLHVALRDLPAEPSEDRIRLRLAVGLNVMLACDHEQARAQSSDALADARALGDPVLEAAALGLDAFALAAGWSGSAATALQQASDAFARLAESDLARRLPGLWMLAWSESALARFEVALEHLRRARGMAEASGRELVLVLVSLESVRPLRELGRLAEAVAAGEEALDRAQLARNLQQLVAAHGVLSSARLAAGGRTARWPSSSS